MVELSISLESACHSTGMSQRMKGQITHLCQPNMEPYTLTEPLNDACYSLTLQDNRVQCEVVSVVTA